MAKAVTIQFDIETLFAEEPCSGERCASCSDNVYGIGYRLILSIKQEGWPLPSFRETKHIMCIPCKNAVEL